MKKLINIRSCAGEFAENKDVAKRLRIEVIMPALSRGDEVVLDFKDVSGVTQSFIHALISDPLREFKDRAFDNLMYQHAGTEVKEIISIVYRYMQESFDGESS